MEKFIIRKTVLNKRKNLTTDEVKIASYVIVNKLTDLPCIIDSKVIMSYMPYGNEVDIRPLNQWILNQGKILCLPRVISDSQIEAVAVDNLNEGFAKGSYGIQEPDRSNEAFDIKKIDTILVPGVAFDIKGNRLGHGRGYYDRFLALCDKHTIFLGIGFSFQLLDYIPSNQYDVKVHRVITE